MKTPGLSWLALGVALLGLGCAVCPLGKPPAARAPISGASAIMSWSKPQQLSTATGLVWAYTRVAAGPSGSAFILFAHDTTGNAPHDYTALYATQLDASGTWTPEQPLQSQAGIVLQSQLAADQKGNALAVWLQQTPAGNTFFASHFSAATGQWGGAVQLTFPVDDTPTSRLAMTPDGDALFVWTTHCTTLCKPAEYRVMALRYAVSTDRWIQPPVPINSARDRIAYWPAIALDANGNALVQWQQADPRGVQAIRGNKFNADTFRWCTDETLSRTNYGAASTPAVAMDAAGNALAVWPQRFFSLSGQPMQGIDARRYNRASNDWQAAQRIDPHLSDEGGMFNPSLVIATNTGDGLAGWLYIPHPPPLTGAAEGRVYSASKQDWDIHPRFDRSMDPNNPRLGGTVQGGYPVLATDPAGDQVALWGQSDNTAWASYLYAPGSFRAPEPLRSAPGALVGAITGAMDLNGHVTAVWMENPNEASSLWVARYQ